MEAVLGFLLIGWGINIFAKGLDFIVNEWNSGGREFLFIMMGVIGFSCLISYFIWNGIR